MMLSFPACLLPVAPPGPASVGRGDGCDVHLFSVFFFFPLLDMYVTSAPLPPVLHYY